MIPADARPAMDGHFHVTADGDVYGPRGRKLRTYVQPNGYATVGRWDPAKGYMVHEGVHRLVCEAYHGPAPADKPLALHRDGNPLNNVPENLYWGDHRENMTDAVRHGTQYVAPGEGHGKAKLTWNQVDAIRSEYAAGGVTQAELGREYGVHPKTISSIVRGQLWKEVVREDS